MGRPIELEMDTSEPSVATELVEFDRISRRLSSTFGSCGGGFGRKFIKLSEFRQQTSCIQMILLQRRLFGEPAMRLNNTWIVRTPEN